MSETDKVEIKSIISNIGAMKELNEKLNGKYVDGKILAFIKEAVKDYKSNKEAIKQIIRENLSLFIDKKSINISSSDFSNIGNENPNKARIYVNYDLGFSIYGYIYGLNSAKQIDSYTFNVSCNDICVADVAVKITNGNDKDCKTSESFDLIDKPYPYDGLFETSYDEAKTAKEWGMLYNLATWTRAKNVLLVRKFKECLKDIAEKYEKMAKEKEKSQAYATSVDTNYVKVDL